MVGHDGSSRSDTLRLELEYDETFHYYSTDNMTVEEQIQVVSHNLEILLGNMDSLFQVLMGSLIILMQAGFGFLEAGSVRAKNTTNILIKNYADLCFGSMAFWFIGFALAFGEGSPIIGWNHWFAVDLSISRYSVLFFQCTFAATCATIVSGAIAERCNFNGYVIFSIVVTGVTYPITAHWCWGPAGWLGAQGFQDFAGSGVVHLCGGVIALVGAIILGPRIDRFKDKNSTFIAGHSIPHISLGGFILIFGFMAFNAGSQGSVSQKGDGEAISSACLSTLVGCASGGITVLFIWKFHQANGKWSLSRIINGCLAGMVSVCAGCDLYYPWMASLIGCIAGILYVITSLLMVKLKVDDPLDAVAVHAAAGLWGLLASPLFRSDGVLFTASTESLNMLLWNAIGAACLIVFHAITGALLFIALNQLDLFRVKPAQELEGLDIIKHDEPAYAFDFSATESMWPGLDQLRTLAKKQKDEEQGIYSTDNAAMNGSSNIFMSRKPVKKVTVTPLNPSHLVMPEINH